MALSSIKGMVGAAKRAGRWLAACLQSTRSLTEPLIELPLSYLFLRDGGGCLCVCVYGGWGLGKRITNEQMTGA